MKRLKKSVINLRSYNVIQDRTVVKLNQNESSIDIPTEIKQEIFRRLQDLDWNRYPIRAPGSLIDGIAGYTAFPSSGIVIGNGSNELVQTIIHATCDSGDTMLTVEPGFPIYERVASTMNIRTAKVPLNADFSFDVPSIIEGAGTAKLVILASPNNPTGTALSMDAVKEIAKGIDAISTI
jgi:histidinol-phosphate aminotransferase